MLTRKAVTACKLLQSRGEKKGRKKRRKKKKKKVISTCDVFLNTLLHFWYFIINPS